MVTPFFVILNQGSFGSISTAVSIYSDDSNICVPDACCGIKLDTIIVEMKIVDSWYV